MKKLFSALLSCLGAPLNTKCEGGAESDLWPTEYAPSSRAAAECDSNSVYGRSFGKRNIPLVIFTLDTLK